MKIIEVIDPLEKIGKIEDDGALFMKDLLPAAAEIKVIKSCLGDDSCLVPVEQ